MSYPHVIQFMRIIHEKLSVLSENIIHETYMRHVPVLYRPTVEARYKDQLDIIGSTWPTPIKTDVL